MGGKSTTSTQTVSIPPEVMARYNAVNARAENVAATPFQPYGNQFVAPLSPTQQAGVQATNVAAGQAQPYYGAAAGLTLAGAQDVGALTPGQIGYYQNPYTQAVVDPTVAALRQQQGQQLSQQQADAIRAGAFGGDRAGIQRAVLQGQQGLATAQAIAPLYQQGYGQAVQTAAGQQGVVAQDLARRMQAGQQLGGLGAAAQQAALQGAQAQLQAGGVEQQTQQADLTARYQQFLQERGYPFQVAQFLANIAMGTGALSGSTTTTTQPSGLFSDERLKHDAKRVGYTDDGLPIYTFKYNNDNKTHMGVMAQDVEKKHPDAVGLAPAGDGHLYKTVDYERVGQKERAYGGGLDASSMGGAVFESGNFADGGLVSETEKKAILANMRQPLGMYQQAGLYGTTPYQTPYGPGLGIRGDAVPVPSLVTAGSLKAPPKGAVQEALSTYQTMKGLGEMGSGLYDVGERVAVGRPEIKDDKGKIIQKASSGLFGSEGTTEKPGWFNKKEQAAHGGLVGRLHYQSGGDLPYMAGQQGYDPLAEVIKQGQQHHYSLPKPGEPPKPQEPLKDVMQTGMQMYSAGKMGSAALDKGKELIGKMTGEGGLTPIASGSEITAMPVPRPDALGAVTSGAAAPTETIAASTPQALSAAGAPTAELAAVAPQALGAAAPVAETAAAVAPELLTAAAPEMLTASAAAIPEWLMIAGLPFGVKTGGRINPHHYAMGGLAPRQGYANEGAVEESDPLHPVALKNYTAERAKSYGLDPDFAVKVFGGESGFRAHAEGDDKSSFNVPQLHYAGMSEKYPRGGLGDVFTKQTGLDARDPKNAREAIDWSLKYVAEDPKRWSNWTVARNLMGGGSQGLSAGAPQAAKSDSSGLAASFIPTKKGASGEEVTDWKKILVPLATGIAGMASAPTRNFPTALAMGLGAGAQAYQNIDTKQVEQELKAREVATGEKRASIEDATRRMQLLTQLRQLAAGYAQRGEALPPYLKQQIDELTRSLTTSSGSPELAGAAKAGQTTLTGGQKGAETTVQPPAQPPVQGTDAVTQSGAGQPEKAAENIQKGPAPIEPPKPQLTSDFYSKLKPDANPDILRQRGREAEAFSQGAGKQMFDEAARLEREMFERGFGIGKNNEQVDIPGWGEYKNAVANMPKLKEYMDAQSNAAIARAESRQRLKNIETIFETFEPGKFADQKAEFQAAVRSLGFRMDNSATINAEKVQELAKEATRMVFSDVKAVGGQPRVIEFQVSKMANPEPNLTPEANRRIVAEGRAALDYADKFYNDLNDTYREQGWKFDPNKFTSDWMKKQENDRNKFHEEADKNIAVRGSTPRENDGKIDVSKLKDGQVYIVEPGMGIPQVDSSGMPVKLRWNDKKEKFERP